MSALVSALSETLREKISGTAGPDKRQPGRRHPHLPPPVTFTHCVSGGGPTQGLSDARRHSRAALLSLLGAKAVSSQKEALPTWSATPNSKGSGSERTQWHGKGMEGEGFCNCDASEHALAGQSDYIYHVLFAIPSLVQVKKQKGILSKGASPWRGPSFGQCLLPQPSRPPAKVGLCLVCPILRLCYTPVLFTLHRLDTLPLHRWCAHLLVGVRRLLS